MCDTPTKTCGDMGFNTAGIAKQELIAHIKSNMHHGPTKLSSGAETDIYLNIPTLLANPTHLNLAVEVLSQTIYKQRNCWPLTCLGGPERGANCLALGVALRTNHPWFTIRNTPKDHGLGGWFTGWLPAAGDLVILVDDVVSTGQTLLNAVERVTETGATVIGIAPLIDRSHWTSPLFHKRDILYTPALTYKDLNIPPL